MFHLLTFVKYILLFAAAPSLTSYYFLYFEVSPLDESFVTLRANFVNKICLNKKVYAIQDSIV